MLEIQEMLYRILLFFELKYWIVISSAPLYTSNISQIHYFLRFITHRENKPPDCILIAHGREGTCTNLAIGESSQMKQEGRFFMWQEKT